ncbi:MAG: DUF1466 family protein [Planctomycetia bacterium]|nr:DUF1466 family protein [Planctomycetia bacterium]
MRGHGRNGVWVAVALALSVTSTGCLGRLSADGVTITPHKPGDAIRPAAAPVPPTQEIEILDPNVDPTGQPTVVRSGFPIANSTDPTLPALPAAIPQQQIDIPPAILVHRFYYTGNRSFQGPMLPGGPLIVSVNHPKTLERVYVPITMPPGAPRVIYTDDTIRYDFGPQSVSLIFGPCGNPRVQYGQSTNAHENTRKRVETRRSETLAWVQRTGIPQGLQRFKNETRSAFGAVADRINDAGKLVMDAFGNLLQFIPGSQFLRSSPEEQAVREQERLQRLADTRPDIDNTFIPRAP